MFEIEVTRYIHDIAVGMQIGFLSGIVIGGLIYGVLDILRDCFVLLRDKLRKETEQE